MTTGTGLPAEACEAALKAAMQEIARSGHLDGLDRDNPAGVEFDLAAQMSKWAARQAIRRALAEDDVADKSATGSTP
jgi:hypothetical protein